jgi:hypothetical protein
MATSRQIRAYAKEHNCSNAEAKAHFIESAEQNVINYLTPKQKPSQSTFSVDESMLALAAIDGEENGFKKIFDDDCYSIYSPILPHDKNYTTPSDIDFDRHLGIYKDILGGVESQSFNLYASIDEMYAMKEEQEKGFRPFEDLAEWYRLAFVYDKKARQFVPLYFNTQDMEEKQMFRNWRGDEMYLKGIFAAVCRTMLASIPLSGFNTANEQLIEHAMLHNMCIRTSFTKNNWLNTYEVLYDLGLHLMEHPDHKDQGLTYYRIKD